jgi:epoxyqueuosine reductase
LNADALKAALRAEARAVGFDAFGVTKPRAIGDAGRHFEGWIADGAHGDMDWLARTRDGRADPNALWPQARSVVVLGLNYGPDKNPLELLKRRERGAISVYAHGDDYHELIKGKLKRIGQWLVTEAGGEIKVFVDTAPVMEKPLAEAAGIGWQGKHTNLVSRALGSWLFLGEIYLAIELPPDEPEADHCGECRRCLDACPTNAFPAAYRLDARRCISYLTIEHKGHIAAELRPLLGNRIYGCDDCLAVCPWNKFARAAQEPAFQPRAALAAPRLAELAALDDAAFRRLFSGSPVKRIGRDRFVRNVLIAIGNSGAPGLVAVVTPLLGDSSPLVRAMAVWALARLAGESALAQARQRHLPRESDAAVRAEWG